MTQHWFAVALLTIYGIVLLVHARTGFNQSSIVEGYLVGKRAVSGVVIGISFAATFASTNSYIGLAGKSYEYGAPWLIFAVMIVVFTAISWIFVAPGLRRFTAMTGALTIPEFFEERYASGLVRIFAGVIITLSSILYLIAIFKGAGNLFQVFFDIPYRAAVGIMFIVVLLYTSVGGFVSVVRTDVVQGILMIAGSVILFVFITDAAGGVESVLQLQDDAATEWLFDLDAGIPFSVLIGIAIAGSMKLLIDPRQISRFYGLRDDVAIAKGIGIAILALLVIQFCLFPLGLYAHFLVVDVVDTDLIVPTLIQNQDIFPSLIADFLVVAIVSAAMSSMDSVLLVAGSVITRDVIGRVVNLSDAQSVLFIRMGVVACAVVAAILALNPPAGIVELTIFSGSLYAACFAPAILLGLHWRRGNPASVMISFVTGVTTLLIWRFFELHLIIHEVIPALVLSFLVYIVGAIFGREIQGIAVAEYFGRRYSDLG